MNCPECGTEVADDRPYCPSCAANLTEDVSADSEDSAVAGPGGVDFTSPAELVGHLIGVVIGVGVAGVILVGGLALTLLILSPLLWYMGLMTYCVDWSNDPALIRTFAELLVWFYDLFRGLYGPGHCQGDFLFSLSLS